jgi:hypothetical protein
MGAPMVRRSGPTEEEFRLQVTEYAELNGCRVLHNYKTRGRNNRYTTSTTIVGWPDLQIMRPPALLVWAELKVGSNKPTPQQLEVLEFLRGFTGAHVHVWYPRDWPLIEKLLRRKHG